MEWAKMVMKPLLIWVARAAVAVVAIEEVQNQVKLG